MTSGLLFVDEGLRQQRPIALWDAVTEAWGYPVLVVCDRFRLGELQDAVGNDAHGRAESHPME